MTNRLDRAFSAITGWAPRRTLGQQIATATVYTLLDGLAVWAGAAIAVGIICTVTGA